MRAAVPVTVAVCSAWANSSARDTSTNVPFIGCDEVACSGELNGAKYAIVMPAKWNGTLVPYAHGYREPESAPPDFAPSTVAADSAPGWSLGRKDVGHVLLDRGCAIAGSGYKSNG